MTRMTRADPGRRSSSRSGAIVLALHRRRDRDDRLQPARHRRVRPRAAAGDVRGARCRARSLSVNGIVDTLVAAAPLILVGLAVGLCFKAGLFNIGGQGQFLMGAVAAAAVGRRAGAAVRARSRSRVALLAGVVAGALYGFIPGRLKAYTGAHEVVTTIMLNYIAIQIVAYLITGPLRAPGCVVRPVARRRQRGAAEIFNAGTGHPAPPRASSCRSSSCRSSGGCSTGARSGFEIRTVGREPGRRALRRDAAAPPDRAGAGRRRPAGGPRRRDRDPRRGALHAGGLLDERRLRRDHRRAARAGEPGRDPVRRPAPRARCAPARR